MSRKYFYPAAVVISLLVSCGHNNNAIDINQKRDNEIDVSGMIVEFPVEDVLIHDGALFSGSDKHLFICDSYSTDKFTTVFSLPEGKLLGQFMNFGGGPDEVAIIGSLNIFDSAADGREKALIIDHGNYRTSIYDVDSALTDPAYSPRKIRPIEKLTQPSHYIYVNDTLGFARKIMLEIGKTTYDQALGKYNLITGELTDFAPEEHISNNKSIITVAKNHHRVIEFGANVDIVKIYDYDGNVIRRIKGPKYEPKAKGGKSYFNKGEIAGDYILGIYSGGDWNTDYMGKKIIVWDMDGNYIATLNVGKRVRDMYYHEPSGMLWMSFCEDDMLFGKLNFQELLDRGNIKTVKTKNTGDNTAAETHKAKKKEKQQPANEPIHKSERFDSKDSVLCGTVPPIYLISPNLVEKLTSWDMGRIIIPKERGKLYIPNEKCPTIMSKVFYIDGIETGRDTKIWVESVKVTPDFIKGKTASDWFASHMFTLLNFGFTKDTPAGDFNGMVEIYVKGFTKPLKFPVSGTVVFE